jgi:hypothetical protein
MRVMKMYYFGGTALRRLCVAIVWQTDEFNFAKTATRVIEIQLLNFCCCIFRIVIKYQGVMSHVSSISGTLKNS